MLYKHLICLLAITWAAAQTKDKPMPDQFVSLKTKCRNNERCHYDGQDLFLEISIINLGQAPLGYPLEYRQESGPSIRLVDTRTKREAYLMTHLADPDLREKFTEIAPGKSVVLEWVIAVGEINQFATPLVDVSAEINLTAEVEVGGQRVKTSASDTIHITGRRRP